MKLSIINSLLCFLLIAANVASHGTNQQAINTNSHPDYHKNFLRKFDFTSIWKTDHPDYIGFKGKNYQRLQIKFLEIKKSEIDPDMYYVSGKTKFKEKVRSFHGTIRIVSATGTEDYKHMNYEIDDKFRDEWIRMDGSIQASYCLVEDPQQKDTGMFVGTLSTNWYLDWYGNLQYDDFHNYSDSFCNNQFVGIWQSYHTGFKETCNWGHHRIPNAGELDWGGAHFAPNPKYERFGWGTYWIIAGDNQQAQEIEASKWWEEAA